MSLQNRGNLIRGISTVYASMTPIDSQHRLLESSVRALTFQEDSHSLSITGKCIPSSTETLVMSMTRTLAESISDVDDDGRIA